MSTTGAVRDVPAQGVGGKTAGGWPGRRQPSPVGRTAALLLDLLGEDERYRRVWRARMERTPTSQVQQSAVARVLAEHLWESGDADEGDEALPRRLKDTVARALSGRNLSPRTLRMFVDAFDMSAAHRSLLWECLDREVGAVPPGAAVPAEPSRPSVPAGVERTWESTSVHERHTVSAHGTVRHSLVNVVRALRPLRTVSVPVASARATVVARHGAVVVPAHGSRAQPGRVDLRLLQPLAAGDTAVLEYDVLPDDGAARAEARTLLQDLAPDGTAVVQVRFHPRRLPDELWWHRAAGPDLGGRTLEPPARVPLGLDHGAHRVLTGGGRGTAGFRWSW